MGRPARRLTGVVGVLSAALVLVGLPSTAAAEQTSPVVSAATKIVGAPAAKPKVTATPLSATARKAAAADIDLPRPVHGRTAVRLLGDDLDEAAALNEMDADDLAELLRSDPSAWVDSEGAVFYKDAAAPRAPARRPAGVSVSHEQVFSLHSKPGSPHTIFLDFDGASVRGTRWHAEHPAIPTTQPAWDPKGDGPTFDESELTSIQAIWASVAEDYAPFDVDVTTVDPGAAAINRSSLSDGAYGAHVVISPSEATSAEVCPSACGSAAYLNAFGATAGGAGGYGYGYQQPAWVFPHLLGPNSWKQIAEAASREVGHQLGLGNDGNAGSGQDAGHGAWAPIMGAASDHPISQWSKGDYPDATNQEDDVATIRSVLGSRTDETGSTVGQAAVLPTDTRYITSRTDVDVYRLGACTGTFSVSADTVGAQPDLDIRLTLLSATGAVLATADPASEQTDPTTASGLNATITQTSASGVYYVAVDGTGSGPWSTGYDDYGSLGAYMMSKTGDCNGDSPAGVPTAVNGLAATPDPLAASVALSWSAPSTPGVGAVTGYLITRSGGGEYAQVSASTTRYTWTGLEFDTAYTFTVTPLNANGAGAASSVPTATSTGTVPPGAPRAVTAAWSPVPQTAVVAWSAPRTSGSADVQFYALSLDGVFYNYYSPSTTGLQFAGLSPGVTYTFGVAAVSSAGTGPVTTATVAVPLRAGNDDFAQRTALSGVSGTIGGDNTESSDESGEPAPTATRAGAGKASVWYSWTAPGSGPVTLTTTSSITGRDTTVDVFTGSSVGTLTKVVGGDDPASGGRLAVVTFDATAGTTYAIGVNGYRTSATGVGEFTLAWAGSAIGAKSTTTGLTAVADDSARSVTLTAPVTASFGTPVGHVDFYDGAVKVGDDFLNSSSPVPTFTVSNLRRGDHVFSAKFVPSASDRFSESISPSRTVEIAASPTATTLVGSPEAQQVTLTAEVVPAAAGTVQFHDGASLVKTGTVAYGKSTVVLTGVAPGEHSYTATFVPGDLERYVGSTSTAATSVSVDEYPPAKVTTTSLSGNVSGRTASLVATVTATGDAPAGDVQFSDGDEVLDIVPLTAGSASLTVADLTRGTHEFTATFVPSTPTAFESSDSDPTSLVIAATPTTTILTASLSGRTVTWRATVSPASEGDVELYDGIELIDTVTLDEDGTGENELTDVKVGDHHYTATFVPTDDLRHADSTSATQDVTIDPAATATVLGSAVSGHKVTLTATVTSAVGAAGTVTFREGDVVVGTGAVAAGVVSAAVNDVSTGTHTYSATFTPTDPAEQAPSIAPNHRATVAATPTTTGLSTSVDGQLVTLSGSVTTAAGALAGKLEFREGDTLVGTVPLSGGSAELDLADVAPGEHDYQAKFVPSGTTHAVSTSPEVAATAKGATATTLQSSVDGGEVTLTATVTGPGTPAGSVVFHEGGSLLGSVSLSDGAASLPATPVDPEEPGEPQDHSYIATFVPTSAHLGSESRPDVVNLARAATTTALTTGVVGREVTLTATVALAAGTGALVGEVQFREDGRVLEAQTQTLANGTPATTSVTAPYGGHSYTATFVPTGGDGNGSTSPEQSVTIAGTTTTTVTTNVTGRTVEATAVVTGDNGTPAGDVTFFRDGAEVETKALTDGTALLAQESVVPGSYNYTATYVPASTASGASSSAASAATVATVAKVTSTTSLEASVAGRTVTLDATVTDDSADGTVRFRDGETLVGVVAVASGAAALTLDDVTPGGHTYTATFVPTDATVYVGSDSSGEPVTVGRIGTTIALEATAIGRTVTLAATPATDSGRLTGAVEFHEGAASLGTVTLDGSTVVLPLPDVTPGAHTYTATFVPTGTTHAGSTSDDIPVTAAEHSTTTDLAATVSVGTVTLDATVESGAGTPPGKVVFRDGTEEVAVVTLVGGAARKVLAPETPGSHSYTATFEPTDPTTYAGSVSPSRTLRVLPIVTTTVLTATPASDQTVQLEAQVTGERDVPSGNVVFRQEGLVVATVAVVAGTAARHSLTGVVPGSHTYTATFVPTSPVQFTRSASTERSVTVDRIATSTELSATVDVAEVRLEAEVDPAAAGKVVFSDDGTPVGQVTVAGGEAVLTLHGVDPGEHGYTATFEPSDSATYTTSSSSPAVTVIVKFPTTTDLRVRTVQRSVSLDATVRGAGSLAGTVQFKDGSSVIGTVTVTSGAATLPPRDVTPGSHDFTATFVPASTSTVSGSDSVVRTTIAAIPTKTVLDARVEGHSVTLDAAVTRTGGVPTGTVEFRDGSTVLGTKPLVAGVASLPVSDVDPGDHAYRAFFTPDDAVALGFSSSDPSFAKIAPAASHTALDLTVDGRTVSFDSVVTSAFAVPAGTVVIREGAKILGTADLANGAAHLELTGVDPGRHTYAATYVPAKAATHVGSTSAERGVTVTATALTATVSVRTVTLRAEVAPASSAPAGSVEFRDGTTLVGTRTVAGGEASLPLTEVEPGQHAYTATFVPADSETFGGSVSSERKVTVAPIVTTTTVDAQVAVRAVTLSATVAAASKTPVGNVVFRDGTAVVGTVAVAAGAASLPLTDVEPGEHTYTATFVPTSAVTFAGSVSSERKVTVAPIMTTTTVDAQAAVRAVTLSATVTAAGKTPAGNVEFRDGTTLVGTRAVAGGAASLPLADVEPGEHGYTATFVPTSTVTFDGSVSSERKVTVAPIVSTTRLTWSVNGREVKLFAAVTTVSKAPVGDVVFREGDDVLGTVAVQDGAAPRTFSNVDPGEHAYTATFVPTNPVTFAGSVSGDERVTVGRIVTTTALLAAVDGQTVTLTATPSTDDGTLTGAVQFHEGSTLLDTVPLVGGVAVRPFTGVAPGPHTYTATFIPNGSSHESSSSTERQVVVPNPTTTALTVSATGGQVALSALVTSGGGVPQGTVEFYEGDVLLPDPSAVGGDGVAAFTLNGVLGGTHTYSAVFVPNVAGFITSSDSESVTVDPTATTTELVAKRADGSRSVVLTSDVSASVPSAAPGGSVTFRDGTTVVGTAVVTGGKATTTLSSVATGDHDYEATFVPTSTTTYAGSTSSPEHLEMGASATTTGLAVSSASTTVTFEATVHSADGVPNGQVRIFEGGTLVTTGLLDDGAMTVALPGVAAGDHTYVATYVPLDDSFVGSDSAARSVRVTDPSLGVATTTGLTASAVRRTVSLSATVAAGAGTPARAVQFVQDGTVVGSSPLTAGSASLRLPGVAAGSHTYSAVFVPANPAAFATSSSPARQVTLAATATTTSLTGSARGTTATLRITIAGADALVPVGTVRVLDGSRTVGQVQLVGGRATLVVPRAKVGKHSYRATFVPSTADFAGSTSSAVAVTVRPSASKTTLTAPAKAKAGSRPTVTVKVLAGAAPAAGKVLLTYGSKKVTLKLKSGRASYRLPKVRSGTLRVTASYLGDATTAKSSASRSIKVSR